MSQYTLSGKQSAALSDLRVEWREAQKRANVRKNMDAAAGLFALGFAGFFLGFCILAAVVYLF